MQACVGESLDKETIFIRIGPDRRLVTVAAPTYLHGSPVK